MIAQVKDSHTAADILVCSLLLLNVLSNKKEAVFHCLFSESSATGNTLWKDYFYCCVDLAVELEWLIN